jgi:hypothetical protein
VGGDRASRRCEAHNREKGRTHESHKRKWTGSRRCWEVTHERMGTKHRGGMTTENVQRAEALDS